MQIMSGGKIENKSRKTKFYNNKQKEKLQRQNFKIQKYCKVW